MKETQTRINSALENLDHLPDCAHIRPKVFAEAAGVSLSTFWRLAQNKRIKTHKLTERTTTVRVGDLRAFLSQQEGE